MVEQIPGTQTGVTQSVLGSQLAPSAQGEHGMGLEGTWEQGLGRSMWTKKDQCCWGFSEGTGGPPLNCPCATTALRKPWSRATPTVPTHLGVTTMAPCQGKHQGHP